MKTLYETILDSTKSGMTGIISDKIKELIEKLNTNSKKASLDLQHKFFKDNDLLLDDASLEKLLKTMARRIKSGDNKAIINPKLKKQIENGVELFADIENYNSISYGVVISVDYTGGTSYQKGYIIYISADCVYVLDNAATKILLYKMDEYFAKYKTVDAFEYSFNNGEKVTRKPFYTGGEYRRYDYKDMKKFFEV